MVGLVVFLWVPAGLERVAGDAWYGGKFIKIYGSVFAAFAGWFALKFAYKRLIVNPTPPENLKQ
jgi:hypothetical protein